MENKKLSDWKDLAEKELRGKKIDTLNVKTAEGIEIKPLYTERDLKGLDYLNSVPGEEPFVRGPRATMYAGRPWTIRQYAGFSTAAESNEFYKKNLAAGQKEYQWRSILPLTVGTIVTIQELREMWGKQVLQLTQLKI